MKITIPRRWYSSLPSIEGEIGAEFENASNGVKLGAAVKVVIGEARKNGTRADLRGAVLTGAVLTRADLRDAVLRDAVLSGADLSGVDLRGADLSGVDLRDVDLRGVDLRDVDLRGAVLRDVDLRGVPAIPNIDQAILAAIEAGGALDMANWHTCETTHCRAGWAVHLAGEEGRKLERQVGSANAGTLIYLKSTPNEPIPDFYCSNEKAMADIRARAAKQAGAQS